MFKLWSELNPKVKEKLKPDLGMRSWNNLTKEEKEKIWKYLEKYFFKYEVLKHNKNTSYYKDDILDGVFSNEINTGYPNFENIIEGLIKYSIENLNNRYKFNTYAITYLKLKTIESACEDFYNIFYNEDEDAVLELLSIYSILFLKIDKNKFEFFLDNLNEVFLDFGLNIILTKQGFIPKQGEKIIDEIYKPTLDFLSDSKWKPVNRELSDAFSDYQKRDFSGSLTHTISAIQGFLQISIDGKLSKLSIKDGINKSKSEGLIPDDIFTNTIFKNIDSIISRERQEKGDPHPKKEYANEQNARLILNLAMVFM